MPSLRHKYLFILSIFVLLFTTINAQDDKIEKWFHAQLKAGYNVDFSKCPGGNVINRFLFDRLINSMTLDQPGGAVFIKNAIVYGDFNMLNLNSYAALCFDHCTFKGEIMVFKSSINILFTHCTIGKLMFYQNKVGDLVFESCHINNILMNEVTIEENFTIEESAIKDSVGFYETTINGDFNCLKTVFYDGANFNTIQIKGVMNFENTTFLSKFKAVSFDHINVNGNTFFNHDLFNSSFSCQDSYITGELGINYTTFNNSAWFDYTQFEKGISSTHSKFSNTKSIVSFKFSTIKTNAEFYWDSISSGLQLINTNFNQGLYFLGSTIDGATFFSYSNISQGLSVNKTNFNKSVNMEDINIGDNLYFMHSKFLDSNSIFSMDGAIIGRSAFFTKMQFNGGVDAGNVKIGGEINFDSVKFLSTKKQVTFNSMTINGIGLLIYHSTVNGLLDLGYLKSSDFVEFHNCTIKSSNFHDLTVEGKLKFDTVTFGDELFLNNVNTNVLELDAVSYPIFKQKSNYNDSLRLEGLSYKQLIIGKENNEDSLAKFISLLDNAQFSRSSYLLFENYLKEHDFDDLANKVYIDLKKREGGSLNFLSWLFFGSGKHPTRIFFWCFVLIVIGGFVFQTKKMEETDGPSTKRTYNAFSYSFELFIPFIKFYDGDKWIPKQKHWFLILYMYFLGILGWVLIPIGIAEVLGYLHL